MLNLRATFQLGEIFHTPLYWKGLRSLPVNQLAAWLGLAWWAGRRNPQRTVAQRTGVGFLAMLALLKWEWLHNLAHAAAAQRAGKPMDRLEILVGMPLCIYTPENHRSTSPRQHIQRALGGPLFNLAAMLITRLARGFTTPESTARDVLDVAVEMNTFLCTASLLPIPGIDGGPILKWGLVEGGHTPAQADEWVRRTDLALSPALSLVAVSQLRQGRWLSSILAFFLAGAAFAVGMGWMRGETRDT